MESYTKIQPVSLSGSTLKYGEFTDIPPFAREPVRLHYENNSPFAVATKMTREVEISHWGNVYVEEYYLIQHTGAKLRVSGPRVLPVRGRGKRSFFDHISAIQAPKLRLITSLPWNMVFWDSKVSAMSYLIMCVFVCVYGGGGGVSILTYI
jgi:hypothetical protein